MSQLNVACFFLRQVILIFSIIQFKPARYGDYVFPPWAQGVGWVIAMGSIIWIPLGAVHTLWVLPGSFMQVTHINHFLFFTPPKLLQVVPTCKCCFVMFMCQYYRYIFPTETEVVCHTMRLGWNVKNAVLWEGRRCRISRHSCHQLQHPSTWKTSYSDKPVIPLYFAQS